MDPNNITKFLVPAMKNVHAFLSKQNLDATIKFSSPLALSVLNSSFPASSGSFKSKLVKPVIKVGDRMASTGDSNKIEAKPKNAASYSKNLVNHVLSGSGTPKAQRVAHCLSHCHRHPILPSYMAADTDLYSIVFPASNDPVGRAELLRFDQITEDQATVKTNKIGHRAKPRPYIIDRTISVLCGEYPINWPGRYVLQVPSTSSWGYYQPMYSWVDEGGFVNDSLGIPLQDSQGRPYRYNNFLSSRPTYGPEYYYLPQAPPPAPLSILTKPPIFGLRLHPPPSPLMLDEQFVHPPSNYFLTKHFPAILNTDPHQSPPSPPFSPRKLAITPVIPVYEEGVYSCTSYMDDFVFTPSEAYQQLPPDTIVSLPPPTYKRLVYPRPTPPQATRQHILPFLTQPTPSPSPPRRKRKSTTRSSLVLPTPSPPPFPKVQFIEPFVSFPSLPFTLYRTPSILDLVIYGHLMCTDITLQLYIPPSIFLPNTSTILIAPDRIHPRLPPFDQNKLKDKKIPVQSLPKPTRFELKYYPGVNYDTPQLPANATRATEVDAEHYYQNFMVKCSKEASSSGLSEEEKAQTLMVRGYRWKSPYKVYHFSDSSAAFLRNERHEIDFDALSRKYFIHTALLNLDLYKDAWQSVTDTWYKPPIYNWCTDIPPWRPGLPMPWDPPITALEPEELLVDEEPLSDPVVAEPISVAPSTAITPAPAPQVVTMDVIDNLKRDIDTKFDRLYALLASSLPHRVPPPS
ncbi:hypothetical protein Fmac_018401 [Flemingia macrophylla]|uniref:glucan endo-1,3-beta-D-glucosidase n=1 Tax=Flemingia macrophylla TaxID=520843 RepID=A0ABD1M4X6_9FABA